MKFDVEINQETTTIHLPNQQGVIVIGNEPDKSGRGVQLFLKAGQLAAVSTEASQIAHDQVITIKPDWDLEADYLAKSLTEYAVANGLLKVEAPTIKIPTNQRATVEDFRDLVLKILTGLGFRLAFLQAPKHSGKPRHRFSKQVSQIAFSVDHDDATATVYWQKRNEMLAKAGARLKPKPELNKDGSVGFSAKFAERLRSEHADDIQDFVTTRDIVLKSVNEVGLFLYFGGINSWLVLKDEAGKSINDWTIVK